MQARRTLVAAALLVSAVTAFAQFTPTTPLPDGYNGHALIASGGFLYNAGGSSNSNGIMDSQNVFYAPVNAGAVGAWKPTTALPEGVFYHAGVAANGFVYILGGQHFSAASGVVTSNVVYYAKANADGTLGAWQTTSNLPETVFFVSAAVWNGSIYATGGWNGSALTAGVYSAKINADGSLAAWTAQKPLPQAVYAHSAVSNGTLYVLGGAVNGGTQIANTVYYSKINADGTLAGWAATTPLPQAIGNHAGIYGNGKVFVLGGWTGTSPSNAVVAADVLADGTLSAWASEPAMPDALYLHAAAVSGQYLFVSGGADNTLTVPTVFSMALPAAPPPPPPTDDLPPRTTAALGAPKYAAAPPFISPATPIRLSAVDDALVVGDGAGVGVQSTQWAVDSGTFVPYASAFEVPVEGAHWVRYASVDKLGHAETPQATAVAVDATPPVSTLNIGAPQAALSSGQIVVGSATVLAVSAQDPVVAGAASGVGSLSVSVDGAAQAGPSFTLPASDGPHVVAFSAVDNVGNAEAAHSQTVDRDGTPPVTTLTPDGSAVLGAGAALAFSAVDPASGGVAAGVNHIEYGLDGGSWTAVSAGLTLPEGVHALQYRAVDNVGNVEAARTNTYRVDLTPPQTTLTVSSGLTLFGVDVVTGQATLTLTAQDPTSAGVASGVARILYSVDGGADQVYSAPFTPPAGAHSVSYGAVDNAGNAETRRMLSLSASSFLSDAAAGFDWVRLSGGASVTGSVRSNGTVTVTGRARIDGPVTQGPGSLAVGAYDVSAARAWAQANNANAAIPSWALSDGVLVLEERSLTLPAGDYYLKGLRLSGGAAVSVSGRVNLFVDGTVSLSGHSSLNASGDANDLWLVVGAGDVSLSGQERSAFNLYAPASDVSMSGGGEYAGRQLGKTISITGKAQQPSTASLPGPSHGPGGVRHLSGAGCGAPAMGDGEADGRRLSASSARLDLDGPGASGFSHDDSAVFGPVPEGSAPLLPGGAGRLTAKNQLPSLQLSSHTALSVVSPDGNAVRAKDGSGVVIPPGATLGGLAVTVAPPARPAPAERRRQDDAVAKLALTPAGAAVQYGPEGTHFEKPVTLEIPYDRTRLPQGVAENSLAVHYWNPGTGNWERLDSSVDAEHQVVRAQTTHFSLYEIFSGGVPAAAPAPGATLAFGQVYAYPNPSRPGQSPTIHVEAGSADHVEIHIYDISGRMVDASSSDGARAAFEYRWDVSGVGSGVYLYVVTATQNGGGKIRHTGRVAVIK